MIQPSRRLLGLLAAGAIVAGACSGDGLSTIPEPPTTVALSTTTTGPDLSAVALRGAAGQTTTTIALGPGAANLVGVVASPDGAVPGAVVRIERLVGDAVARADITTNPDGTWAAPAVLGGRYRVRAWRSPNLAMTKPQVFFLEADEKRELTLRMNRYEGIAVTNDMAPNPPAVNQPASLVVLVTERTVDADGVVRANPIANVGVELMGSSNWRLDSANPVTTDANGQARWQLRCRSTGSNPLSVVVQSSGTHALEVPDCTPAAPTTTASTSTTVLRTTSTTRRSPTTTS